jgi:hypothetical protein
VPHKYGVISCPLNNNPGSGNRRIFFVGISIYSIDIVNDRRRKVTDFNYHDMAVLKVIFVSLFKGLIRVSVLAYRRTRG